MEVQDLRNYGKSGCELSSSWSKELEKRASKTARKIASKHLGFMGMVTLMFQSVKERRRMLKQDFSSLREKGMTNERFITKEINRLAVISALSRILGTEKALQISNEVLELTAPQFFAEMLPSREALMKFNDPFDAFRQYFFAMLEADERTGHHRSEIVENANDAFQADVTYCAFYEIAKQLGMAEACLPHCSAHEHVVSGELKPLGIVFKMTRTLVDGASRCDLRYERVRNE